jgi:uroporphyrinogen III methyltransferase/synthase
MGARAGVVTFVGLGPCASAPRGERASQRMADADAVVPDEGASASRLIELARQGKRVVRTVAGDPFESPRVLHEAREVAGAGFEIEVVPAVGAAARWAERRPLFGKRVLVTRAREQAEGAAARLRDRGADVLVIPTIELADPSDPEPLRRALSELRAGSYGCVAFTSANGVERTWKALVASGADARSFGSAKLAAIGPATARALESHGLRPDIVAKEFVGEDLAREILLVLATLSTRFRPRPGEAGDVPSPRVLVPRAARARDVLPEALRAAGYSVDVVAAYETHPPAKAEVERLLRELEEGRVDVVTFTSSSTVENLCDLLGSRAATILQPTRVASIGPVTTETARARGVRVDVTAREYTVPGLVDALVESYA